MIWKEYHPLNACFFKVYLPIEMSECPGNSEFESFFIAKLSLICPRMQSEEWKTEKKANVNSNEYKFVNDDKEMVWKYIEDSITQN